MVWTVIVFSDQGFKGLRRSGLMSRWGVTCISLISPFPPPLPLSFPAASPFLILHWLSEPLIPADVSEQS